MPSSLLHLGLYTGTCQLRPVSAACIFYLLIQRYIGEHTISTIVVDTPAPSGFYVNRICLPST